MIPSVAHGVVDVAGKIAKMDEWQLVEQAKASVSLQYETKTAVDKYLSQLVLTHPNYYRIRRRQLRNGHGDFDRG